MLSAPKKNTFARCRRGFGKTFNIHYIMIGDPSEKPVIVFHHGNGNSSNDWIALGYGLLAKDYCLVFVDMMGYGLSGKSYLPADYAPILRAKDTIAVLDKIGATENVIFFGGSMGGQLAFTLALDESYSKYFSMFITNGASPYGTAELSPLFVEWLTPAIDGGTQIFVDALEEAMGEPFHPDVKPSFLANDIRAMIASNTIAWPDYSAQLSEISQPFLQIVGDNDGVKDSVIACDKALGKHSQLIILKDKDHVHAYWDGVDVVPYMKQFIAKTQLIQKKKTVKSSRGCCCGFLSRL